MRLALMAVFLFSAFSHHCLCDAQRESGGALECAETERQDDATQPCSPAPLNCKTTGMGCDATECVDLTPSAIAPFNQSIDLEAYLEPAPKPTLVFINFYQSVNAITQVAQPPLLLLSQTPRLNI